MEGGTCGHPVITLCLDYLRNGDEIAKGIGGYWPLQVLPEESQLEQEPLSVQSRGGEADLVRPYVHTLHGKGQDVLIV